MSHRQQHAEASDFLIDSADLVRHLVGATHDPDVVQQIFCCDLFIRHVGVSLHQTELPHMRQEGLEILVEVACEDAFKHVLARLFGGFSDIDLASDAPCGTVSRATGTLCALAYAVPVGRKLMHGNQVDAHRNPAALSREIERLRLGRHTGDPNGRVRQLVRLHVKGKADLFHGFGDGKAPVLMLIDTGLRVVPYLQDGLH